MLDVQLFSEAWKLGGKKESQNNILGLELLFKVKTNLCSVLTAMTMASPSAAASK